MGDFLVIGGITYRKNQVENIDVLDDGRYEVILYNGTKVRYHEQTDNGEERQIVGTTVLDDNNKPVRTTTKIVNCDNISIFQSEKNSEVLDTLTLNNTKAETISTFTNTFVPKQTDILYLNNSSYKNIINKDISIFEN